jgi:lipopolysaccharide export system protein LptC
MATYVNKRTAHRSRLLLVMLTGVFCAFGSFWLLQVMTGRQEGTQGAGRSSEPDYIVENFSFVRMSEKGLPGYVVSGARLTHRPIDDMSEIEQPVVQSMATEHPRMTLHAKRARVLHEKDQIDLSGNVDVQRPGTAKSKPMRLRSEALTVLPDEEIMKTDAPVVMTLGSATVRSVGMVANNATQQVHLASQGHMTLPARAARNANPPTEDKQQ